MKSEDRPKLEIAEAVALLKERKKALEKREKELASKETQFDRAGVEGLAKRRFFYAPAFSIYGGQTHDDTYISDTLKCRGFVAQLGAHAQLWPCDNGTLTCC